MTTKNPSPPGWPRISSALFYDDASAAIDWLCAVFGFQVRLRIAGPDGRIIHSELTLGDGVVMVAQASNASKREIELKGRSPRSLDGALTQALFAYVDDVEAFCAHAKSAGARIVEPPTTQEYGPDYWSDRTCRIEDCEGHHWFFAQRLRTGSAS